MIDELKDIITIVGIALIASMTIIIGLALLCLVYPFIILVILFIKFILLYGACGFFICAILAYLGLTELTLVNCIILGIASLVALEIISH